jgi:Cys-tRNA(Pro) deacylase
LNRNQAFDYLFWRLIWRIAMSRSKAPVTPAVRALRAAGVTFTDHLYDYEEKGGTAVSARELGVEEHSVVKTLVMEDDHKQPLIVLMHGDMQVSTKELARVLGVKGMHPCSPDEAMKHTGYMVGGTSPFGTRRQIHLHGGVDPRAAENLHQRRKARLLGRFRAEGGAAVAQTTARARGNIWMRGGPAFPSNATNMPFPWRASMAEYQDSRHG